MQDEIGYSVPLSVASREEYRQARREVQEAATRAGVRDCIFFGRSHRKGMKVQVIGPRKSVEAFLQAGAMRRWNAAKEGGSQ